MTAVIFTHPPDYLAAAYAARSLRRAGVKRVVLAVDRAHPLPVAEGCEALRTDFPRNGNLNGKRCVEGILKLLEASAGPEDEWVLKVDSDAIVSGFRWLEGRDEEAVGLCDPEHRGFYGFCYALRVAALPGFRARAAELPEDATLYEDETMGELARPAHRYINRTAACPMAAYSWKIDRSPAEWMAKHEAIAFQRGQVGIGRREVADTMRRFL